jgi:hypothetical protein
MSNPEREYFEAKEAFRIAQKRLERAKAAWEPIRLAQLEREIAERTELVE